ncbi:MAG: ABC transporter substrate-binding protein [Roseitalea sp.]|jgi:peptide/nickel transport system substrate-binding protein|nr:ABC transporter substrate-binding protein [Roseitalea sp.]MBO6723917.1 ABC transporter substrate-binding protein [Roseitalea sp.]MBO6744396.1 ABC transporter substrate-binding protein [Roseitalea sp.]
MIMAAALAMVATATGAEPMHGIAMHGDPALPADYTHFPYANPDAPHDGAITYGVVGTFDSLNPFVLKSMRTTARGIWDPEFGNLVFESLMVRSRDEPFTMYGLLAETIETDDERTWVEFTLNADARWSDGVPVTPEDVIFTYDILTEKGRPPFNRRMARIERIEKTGERSVKFHLNDEADREFPLLLALTPVLPAHATDVDNFEGATLEPPVGSGPYLVESVEPGARITYRRNPDYWGRDIPAKQGFDNYARITVEYFRDTTARFEAFKKGVFDIYPESDPIKWETAYDFPAVTDGRIVKQAFGTGRPQRMLGFFFNTRRDVFADRNVREALAMLFDFEWVNANLFSGRYTRTGSFWQNSEELSALGRPAGEREQALLAPFADAVQPSVMDGSYAPVVTDGSGRDRAVLRRVVQKLGEAGYAIEDGRMVRDGEQLAFEILLGTVPGASQNEIERMALSYQTTAGLIGVDIAVRGVDDAQFQKRRQTWDYDMVAGSLSSSLSPGGEQIWRWGSESRDPEGTFNYAGAADPAIDTMIAAMVDARAREDFAAAVRALDRLLISGHYVVPLYHLSENWVAHWSHIGQPPEPALYGYQLPVWWSTRTE